MDIEEKFSYMSFQGAEVRQVAEEQLFDVKFKIDQKTNINEAQLALAAIGQVWKTRQLTSKEPLKAVEIYEEGWHEVAVKIEDAINERPPRNDTLVTMPDKNRFSVDVSFTKHDLELLSGALLFFGKEVLKDVNPMTPPQEAMNIGLRDFSATELYRQLKEDYGISPIQVAAENRQSLGFSEAPVKSL